MKKYISIKEQTDFLVKKQYFIDRTNRHIDLVKKYFDKILNFSLSNLIKLDLFKKEINCHDESKFMEPELIPYIKLTWDKKLGIENKNNDIFTATIHHCVNNKHHPEYWTNQTENLININDRDKPPEEIINATKMPLTYVTCMVDDWCAMAEELKDSPIEWADKNINIRWKFTDKQKDFIYKLLNEIWLND